MRIEGMDSLQRRVEQISSLSNLDAALGRACALVERSAKQKAPKDTGALRRSITSKVEGTQGIVYTTLEYAPYIEFGTGLFAESSGRANVPWCYQDDEGVWHSTSGQKPQPFMRPALNENRVRIIEMIKEGLE